MSNIESNKYTYTIFDANPYSVSGSAWTSHQDIEIDAHSDEEALDAVRDVMSEEAVGLNPGDGYEVGQTLWAIVWGADEAIVGSPTYDLTAEDLGVEEADESEEGLSAADVSRWIEELSFVTPQENEGQIVLVSYACDADYIYARSYDQSDRSTSVSVYEHPEGDEQEWSPWNGVPATGELVGSVDL